MKRTVCAALLVLAWQTPAWASDPIGVYALIDKVVMEPNEQAPTRIQVWGAFAFARNVGGDTYDAPVRGYLYYRIVKDKEDMCRREWADMKRTAGSGMILGMGSRYERTALGTVRRAGARAEKPDLYPISMGLTRVRRNTDYPPIYNLITLPAPTAPVDGATVEPGKVTLITRNIMAPGHGAARYVFALENASGQKETSDPLEAGATQTKWTPRMRVQAGEKYTWSVHLVDGRWTGPRARAAFQGKARP